MKTLIVSGIALGVLAVAGPAAAAGPSTQAASPTPSATPPTPCAGCPQVFRTTVTPREITAGGGADVTVSAATGSRVQLLAYSQPSTTYRVVREGTADRGGITFRVTPATSTRLYARTTQGEPTSSVVLTVRSGVSLSVAPCPYGPPVLVDDEDNGRTVDLRYGQKIVVTLRNPGDGGYTLRREAVDTHVLQAQPGSATPGGGLPGDFGTQTYPYRAVGGGTASLGIGYHQFDGPTAESRYVVRVRVSTVVVR